MELQRLISRMFQDNISVARISKILEISQLEVYKSLDEQGIDYFQEKDKRNDQIVKCYESGMKINDIAKMFNMDRHGISGILINNCPSYVNKRAKTDAPSNEKRNKEAIRLYCEEQLSLREVAKKLNIAERTVYLILSAYNIPRRARHRQGHSLGTTKNRKHTFNFKYFKSIQNEEQAYWLGFLYADGYVSYKGTVVLALQIGDREHLEKFRDAVEAFDANIYTKKQSCGLTLSSVEMARDLIRLGCVQKKSLILTFPESTIIPECLLNHFMRGYFDGDGCIYVNEKQNSSSTWSLLGTKEFVTTYENILLQHCKNQDKNMLSQKGANTYQISYSGARVADIYNFLYKNATIYLERKKKKFDTVIGRFKENS